MIDNEKVIKEQIYPALAEMGLRQNREKWYLDDAGHRGFSVDVGSSRGEVLIRIEDGGIQVERIPILHNNAVGDALTVVALLVTAKQAEVKA